MNNNRKTSEPLHFSTQQNVHPGILLAKELDHRAIDYTAFATSLELPVSEFSEFLEGRRNMTIKLALQLEEALGISAATWIHQQGKYKLSLTSKLNSE